MTSKFTVQPSKNKIYGIFRLGLDKATSDIVKKHEWVTLILESTLTIRVKIVCGPPSKKTYDVNKRELKEWIKKYDYHVYPNRKPTKLIFRFDKSSRTFKFSGQKQTSP